MGIVKFRGGTDSSSSRPTTSGLTRSQVDDRVRALVNAIALAGNNDAWADDKIADGITRDAELTAAIDGYLTDSQISDLIAALNEVKDGGVWVSSGDFQPRTLVRYAGAAYLCIRRAAPGSDAITEPGAGSDWQTYWYRIGHPDGLPPLLIRDANLHLSANFRLDHSTVSEAAAFFIHGTGTAGATPTAANWSTQVLPDPALRDYPLLRGFSNGRLVGHGTEFYMPAGLYTAENTIHVAITGAVSAAEKTVSTFWTVGTPDDATDQPWANPQINGSEASETFTNQDVTLTLRSTFLLTAETYVGIGIRITQPGVQSSGVYADIQPRTLRLVRHAGYAALHG